MLLCLGMVEPMIRDVSIVAAFIQRSTDMWLTGRPLGFDILSMILTLKPTCYMVGWDTDSPGCATCEYDCECYEAWVNS